MKFPRLSLPWPVRIMPFAAIGLGLSATAALADAGDTINFVIGSQLLFDNNLFRQSPNNGPRSEQVTFSYAGFAIDKTYSQQRLTFDVTARDYQYRDFSQLSFNSLDYKAGWLWHLTQRLSGNIEVDRKVNQTNFADSLNAAGLGANTITTENRRLTGDWWFHGNWHAIADASEYTVRNSQNNQAQDSHREQAASLGLRYVANSGSTVTLTGRNAAGAYSNRPLNVALQLDTGYTQQAVDLRATWALSGKSNLGGRITRLRRQHDNLAARDYRGTAGQVDFSVTPTGKLQLAFSATRNIASFQSGPTSFFVDDSLTFTPTWQIDSKASLQFSLQQARRKFLGDAPAPVVSPLVPVGRRDQTESAQIRLLWSPIRAVNLSVSMQHSRRDSNTPNADFRDNSAGLSAEFQF